MAGPKCCCVVRCCVFVSLLSPTWLIWGGMVDDTTSWFVTIAGFGLLSLDKSFVSLHYLFRLFSFRKESFLPTHRHHHTHTNLPYYSSYILSPGVVIDTLIFFLRKRLSGWMKCLDLRMARFWGADWWFAPIVRWAPPPPFSPISSKKEAKSLRTHYL